MTKTENKRLTTTKQSKNQRILHMKLILDILTILITEKNFNSLWNKEFIFSIINLLLKVSFYIVFLIQTWESYLVA